MCLINVPNSSLTRNTGYQTIKTPPTTSPLAVDKAE